jgi:hypothetical protein
MPDWTVHTAAALGLLALVGRHSAEAHVIAAAALVAVALAWSSVLRPRSV